MFKKMEAKKGEIIFYLEDKEIKKIFKNKSELKYYIDTAVNDGLYLYEEKKTVVYLPHNIKRIEVIYE